MSNLFNRKIFTFETSWDVGPVEAQPAWDEEAPSEPSEPTEAKGQRVRVRRNRRGKEAEEVRANHRFDSGCFIFPRHLISAPRFDLCPRPHRFSTHSVYRRQLIRLEIRK